MIYIIEYQIRDGGKHLLRQTDGEWYSSRSDAEAQAKSNAREFGWRWRVYAANVPERLPGWKS